MYASLQKQNERGHALLSPRRSIRMNHTVSLYIRSLAGLARSDRRKYCRSERAERAERASRSSERAERVQRAESGTEGY